MTRFKYYSNYLACLLGTLIAFELCWIGAKYVIEGEVVHTCLDHFIAVCGSFYINGNLFIKLPSGRKLCYWNTHLKMNPRDGREHIVYMGVNQETKQWGETETYGGKLVENITQAIARDCLAISMQRVAALGYNIVMHVHDEMIVDVPIEDTDALERINACMGEAIPWAPGLPLRGDGYETPFYMKD